MNGLRKFMQNNPMAGWVVAAVLMLAAALAIWRQFVRSTETTELTEMITIRCVETGKEWKVPRGVMEKELYLRDFPVDANKGLINPDTGKFTGFPVDAWKETVERVNAERSQVEKAGSSATNPGKP